MSAKRRPRKVAPKTAGDPPSARPRIPLLAVALFAAALVVPLVAIGAKNHLRAVDITAGAVGVAATAVGIWLLQRRGCAWPVSRLGIAWLAFLAWTLAGAVASGRFWSSFVGQPGSQLGWAMFVAITALVLAARQVPSAVRGLLLTWGPVYLAAQAISVFVQLAVGQQPRGTLPNSTYFGEMVLLLLPFAVQPDAFDEEQPWLAIALPLVMVSALAASGSRVATVVALAWVVWTFGRSDRLPAATKRIVITATLVAVVAAGLFFARGEILGTASKAALGDRPAMLHIATAAVTARPLVGWGLEGFSSGGARVSTMQLAETGPMVALEQGYAGDPHNIVANIVVSAGVIGLALFAWLLFELVRSWRHQARSGGLRWDAVWAVGGFMVVLFTAPATPHVMPLFALALGLSLPAIAAPDPPPSRTERLRGVAMLALATAVSALLAANLLTRVPLDAYGPDSARIAATAQRAADFWRVDPQLYYLASMHWGYAAQVDPAVAAARPDLAAIEKASDMDPREPFYQFELARTLRFYREDPARVEGAFAETFDRYPLFPLARAEYAAFLAEQGRYEEARRELATARLVRDAGGASANAIAAAEQLLEGK